MQANKPLPESFTLDNILANFASDEQARSFLEKWLWPNGPTCPRCASNDPQRVYRMTGKSTRPGLCNCRDCRRQFTVTVGTIFEDSHIPLRKWLVAWYLLCSSKKGISSLQLQRILDLGSYRTALFMTHRIRHALRDPSFPDKLEGVVEIDETYLGGKQITRRAQHKFVNPKAQQGKPGVNSNKVCVVSLVQRDGSKRSMLTGGNLTAKKLHAILAEHVEPKTSLMTDGFSVYKATPHTFKRRSVNHGVGEYAWRDGDTVVHTNTVESSFSLLKRGIIGTFHNVSKHHLPLYLAEFDFRWSHSKVTDGERTVAALKKASGKRLTYHAIIAKRKTQKEA